MALLFELSSFAMAALVFLHLWRRDHFMFWMVLAAVATTILVETEAIRVQHTYWYDPADWLVLIGSGQQGFPLAIAIDWGLIVFTAVHLTSRLRVAWWLLPFAAGTVAVSMDFTLDPVAASSRLVSAFGQTCTAPGLPDGTAVGLGLWVWCIPPDSATLGGVPLPNFWAWHLLVTSFVLVLLTARLKVRPPGASTLQDLFIAAGSILLAASGFLLLLMVGSVALRAGVSNWLLLAAPLLGGVAVVLSGSRKVAAPPALPQAPNPWALAVVGQNLLFCWLVVLFTEVGSRMDGEDHLRMAVCSLWLIVLVGWLYLRPHAQPAASIAPTTRA